MRVLDASAVVEWLLGTERGRAVHAELAAGPAAEPVDDPVDEPVDDPARRLPDSAPDLHAPGLLDVEVLQTLRRIEAGGHMDRPRADGAARLLADLPVRRWPVQTLAPRIWALRANLSAYDAAYVALAEGLACPLVTCDARLGRAPGHGAEVRVVG